MSEPDEDLTEKRLKVVLVGDSAAGKVSVVSIILSKCYQITIFRCF